MITLSQFDDSFECLVLTETRNDFDIDFMQRQGYDLLYNFGNVNKCDGTIVYLKNTIDYTSTIVTISECKAIEIICRKEQKIIKITALYRSPATNDKEFVNGLYDYLCDSDMESSDVHVIMGDINIDLLSKDNTIVSEYLDILSSFNFNSTVNTHTRIQRNSKSCLDHIW